MSEASADDVAYLDRGARFRIKPVQGGRYESCIGVDMEMMMKQVSKLTLDRPATYQIQVPGQIGASWSDWIEGMTIAVDSKGDGPPITTLTGTLDQAALQGLLRRLYGLGVPLISVVCVECGRV